LEPYHEWYEHVINLDCVQRTLPDKDRYLSHIGKYADSSARSKVANAVRRGVAAHELDDEKDQY
jgi:glutathione S-transferase